MFSFSMMSDCCENQCDVNVCYYFPQSSTKPHNQSVADARLDFFTPTSSINKKRPTRKVNDNLDE